MILLIDVGNTRTKWALAGDADTVRDSQTGALSHFGVCMNAELSLSSLQITAQKASKVVVANVAGEQMAQRLQQLLLPLSIHFIKPTFKACGVTNAYFKPEKLGVDRWAALIAAWFLTQQSCLVVNAGTAITIDALNRQGVFLGGTIMPGLHLMRAALDDNTANLGLNVGEYVSFPNNTKDAIETGCINAAIGAIMLMLNKMQMQESEKLQVLLTGGDASKLLAAINQLENKVIIAPYFETPLLPNLEPHLAPNLVLQGLFLLERERA